MPSPSNSKVSRVDPIFAWLAAHGGDNWPDRLVAIAHGVVGFPVCGGIEAVDFVVERTVSASPSRLAWMIRNADILVPQNGRRWQDLSHRLADQCRVDAALALLDAGHSEIGNLRLEGDTHADCLIECERTVIWIEGKRFDRLAPSTTWDLTRDQVARNMEAASILAAESGKDFCVIVCHEHPLKKHEMTLIDGYRSGSLIGGLPHLSEVERRSFTTRVGTVTWQRIAAEWPSIITAVPALADLGHPCSRKASSVSKVPMK